MNLELKTKNKVNMSIKYAIGYQLPDEQGESFTEMVRTYQNDIAEVYFPWMDTPTCRAPLSEQRGYVDWTAQKQLEDDLRAIKECGVKVDILFNANCYGGEAVSQRLANRISSILDYLNEVIGGVEIATTTSPAIAHIIKKNFPEIELRASVNMRIGTIKGMEYLDHLFDSFHLQREYNRDFARIEELKSWTDTHGKKLIMLANSGCMRFCSGQIFHDNLVAHEQEIDETHNIADWNPHLCWNFFKDRKNWVHILQNTWIRPEDIHHYDGIFPVVKLATRMHSRPEMVIKAYIEQKFYGNLLDLCEPGFSPLLAPYIIDNTSFPEDWFEKTSKCKKNCNTCDYCQQVLEKVLKKMEL